MEEKIKMSREELEEKLSGEEAKDKAVENIVKMSKDTGADPLTATLYNYAWFLAEGTMRAYPNGLWEPSESLTAAFVAALRHFCEDGYLDQEKIQEEYVRALQQGIIDYTMPF